MNNKLKHTLLLATLICGMAQAENNTFYFNDAIIMPGLKGNIELSMRNTATDLTCFEAEIQLPEGLSVVCDEEGKPVARLYGNRIAGHELLTNVLDNGNLKLMVSSVNNNRFRGEDGPFLIFRVQAAEDAPIGEFTVETVGESIIVTGEAKAYYSAGVTGNVLITNDPTGIESTDNGQRTMDNAIYNLFGQRVSKAKKGIFIRGGKKVSVK